MGIFYILEFGGQHTDLIGNRLEALGHRVKYVPSNTTIENMSTANGIILSGGPKSVYQPDSYPYDPKMFFDSTPVLGICYGMQLMAKELGAKVGKGREYGQSELRIVKSHTLFKDVPTNSIVWNNHGDTVLQSDRFDIIAYSDKALVAAMAKGDKVGVQFHPELTHTEYGTQILRNFAEKICGSRGTAVIEELDAARYIERAKDEIRDAVGKRKALVYLSGGVDSTVAYMLTVAAGVDLIGVHLDMGIERKNEAAQVKQCLERLSGENILVLNYEGRVIEALTGLADPEDKRKAFRQIYNVTAEEVLRYLGLAEDDVVFIDGTLATDRRESGKEAAKKDGQDTGTVATIKTHHNVDKQHRLPSVEPLRYLSKDGVRQLSAAMNIPDEITKRKPFPGPGFALRIISGVYPLGQDVQDAVWSIAGKNWYRGYATPIKTVGLKGDDRSFEHLAVIIGDRNWESITKVQKELAEEAPVNRTVFMDQRWTRRGFDPSKLKNMDTGLRIDAGMINLLQETTETAEKAFQEWGIEPAQLPVIAFPTHGGIGIAVRDVHTRDFRSVRPLRKPDEMPWELCDTVAARILESAEVRKYGQVDAVVFDVSTKPAATTEWE